MEQKKILFSLGKYLLFSVILTGIFLIILSFLRYRFDLKESLINGGVIITYVISCFFAGRMAGKRMQNRRFVYGALMGGTYFLLLLAVSAGTGGAQWKPGQDCITVLLLCTAGGTLGGIVS
ncbi:MAG TPA: TIGR04086 family membrane protein [Lachnospiraceae bacterium]|nr:TIGR04086 family membrane protein [Lachnospiraceae bacterium]